MKTIRSKKIAAILLASMLVVGTTATAISVSAIDDESTPSQTSSTADLVTATELKTDGTVVDGKLNHYGDYVYYKIVVKEDGKLTFKTTNKSVGSKLTGFLNNEDFSTDYHSFSNTTDQDPLTTENSYYLYAGTYFLKFYQEYEFDDKDRNYSLSATFEASNSNIASHNDDYKNAADVSISTSSSKNQYNHMFAEKAKFNWYKFTLDKKTDITMVCNANDYIYLHILNNEVNEKLYGNEVNAPSTKLSFTLDAGTYYFRFGDNSGLLRWSNPCMYSFYYYETAKGDPIKNETSDTSDTSNTESSADTSNTSSNESSTNTSNTSSNESSTNTSNTSNNESSTNTSNSSSTDNSKNTSKTPSAKGSVVTHDNNNSATGTINNNTAESNGKVDSDTNTVATGDNNNVPFVLALISAAATAATILFTRKKHHTEK